MSRSEELYVGYRKRAPEATTRFLRPRLALLGVAVAGIAALLAAAQRPFDPGAYEIGRERTVEGLLIERPYPMVAVEGPTGRPAMRLLVLAGKHGAAMTVGGLDGRRVRLRGTPIVRAGRTMLELADGEPEDLGAGGTAPERIDLGPAVLRGEIVDSKCFLGVMKPSRQAPHRECARNCVAGGIPPALWVPTERGGALFFLVDRHGMAVGPEVLPWIGRPVEVRGAVRRLGDLLLLSVDSYRSRESV